METSRRENQLLIILIVKQKETASKDGRGMKMTNDEALSATRGRLEAG